MQCDIMLRLVLVLVLHCLLTNGQGPGPGPGDSLSFSDIHNNGLQSRAVDTRVRFTVLEGQDANTYVGTIPIKAGYTYRFNEPPAHFRMNASTGEIRTMHMLDRETLHTDTFDLLVLSSQPTYPIEVRIAVIDINDNAPRFPEPSIHVSFSENANAGTRVILDTATDGDAGGNDITTNYKIVSGNSDNNFRLVVTTNPSGETPYLHLETTEKLDREAIDSYQLNISAQDGGQPPHFGYLLVNVSVLDVNDNSPTFDHSDYNASLSESVKPGTSVLQVKATDIDVGENAHISYYLSKTETQFSVDSQTGVITTVEPLRCYKNCPQQIQCQKSCVFTVFARDHGSPRQDGRTYVTVNLQDANDHDPVVSFRYFSATDEFGSVDENAQNGSRVAVVSIIDEDEGLNGETTAEIRGGNELQHFRLDSKNSFDIVRVNGVLDREKISKYNVTIVATDKGTPVRSSTAFLIIFVNDINDHEPVFEKSEYAAVLSELVPVGTYVAGITANDEDTGVNSNIYYDIKSGNDNQWFTIDRRSGLITTKANLDRELEDSVVLKISARDGGSNPKLAYTHLKINILDENDEKPTFDQQEVNVTLSEDSAPGTLVANVFAVDRDRGTNGTVTYVFDEDVDHRYPGVFSLDASSGRVITKSKLDREAVADYVIRIVAKDQGVPPLSSTTTIHLDVSDVNDNSPVFYPHKYFVVVAEDMLLGSSVLQVTATDQDDGDNALISYRLVTDDQNTFQLDSKTGIITLNGRLSIVKKSHYELTIEAEDKQGSKAAQNAIVQIVIEGNEISPIRFNSKSGYKFNVAEDFGKIDAHKPRNIGRVALYSRLKARQVKFSIVSGDPKQVLKIDEVTGVIQTNMPLDREEKSFYNLEIVATSDSSYGKTWANITVTDINDNAPRFSVSKAKIAIAENLAVGYEIFLAEAFDPDDGLNSKITYEMTKNPHQYFYISKSNGMIYLNKSLTYGAVNEFNVEINARDYGQPRLSSRLDLLIKIEDVNDHTPIFEHESYETSLMESTPVNDRFFALTASDKDHGINGFISYDITQGNEDHKFGIFPDGFLYIKSALDREDNDYYALTIVAKDHGSPSRSSTVSVVIHILDENDNPPLFTNKTFVFYLDENEPPDTYVGRLTASDKDRGRNAELTYEILTAQNDFVVDPKSGFLKTLHYFDREKLVQMTGEDYVSMEGVVLDNGVNRLRDASKIIIYITDVNDNAPRFSKESYRAEISEGSPVTSQVIRMGATDEDEDLNGDIVFSIISGNDDEVFELDEATGEVSLAQTLDRELISSYELEIGASDLGFPKPLTATTTLSINVLDENDNSPVFVEDRYEISVIENAKVNTDLFIFQATDADLRVNQQISFAITAGNIYDTFRIDAKRSSLILEKPLDYEHLTMFKLNVTATDGGIPRLSSSITFTVHVLDFNDNPPIFPNTAIVRQIREGISPGTAIVTADAEDPDSGVNGKIKYSIQSQDPPGQHFTIDEDTAVISTKADIDREFADTFRITVVAIDQSVRLADRLSADKLVTVIVEDINDNAPLFVSMNAGIVPYNAPLRYQIMNIEAKDIDANSNGHVTYDLIGGEVEMFTLERNGSLRIRRALDASQLMYHINVRATDEAVKSHQQFTDARLTILVESPNAHSLTFSQSLYIATTIEGSPIGTPVVVVTAQSTQYDESTIAYYVVNVTSKSGRQVDRVFDMQQHNTLATATVLDRENGPKDYIVTVAAILTQGPTSHLTTVQVHIEILDTNDSPPSLKDIPLRYEVSEDLLSGRTITTISATDPDTIGPIRYSLVAGHDGNFDIDPTTGQLSLKSTLDREMKDTYDITVRADDSQHFTEATIQIDVTDTNDNPPIFDDKVYSFDIAENCERGSKVGAVSATDIDIGVNGQVSYSVISDWGNDIFSFNPQTGIFTLTSGLDYEQVQHYIFVVQAQDTGRPPLSSAVTVYFNVKDINDNAPVFDPMSYSDEIYENITIGSSVLTLSATDQDSGLNGQISYRITGGDDKDQFRIEEDGTIYTAKELDREDQSFYNLIVVATDRALIPRDRLSSTVQVTIILKDVNDMAPEFVTHNETVLAENSPINTVIMAIKAIDRDEGRNSYIEYSLAPVPRNTFMLGSADGLLRITAPIDRETTANYTLVVTARDRGTPSNENTLTIFVKVADENDNAPIFDPKQYSASVPENASIGLSVLQVSATDADEGFNGKLRYTIVAGDKNRDFTISEDTGIIRVAKNLNYERRNHYLLTVQAEDSGSDVRYDSSTVTISIMDINDNAPIFLDSPYLIYVMENTNSLPSPIATVIAFDADNSPYNTVNYLVKEGDKSLFSVNSTTGQISLLRALDRELQQHHLLTVVAMDTGTPRLTGTGTISVLVQDENDHSPEFQSDRLSVDVSEGVAPGTAFLTVSASDKDANNNALIRYSLLGGDSDVFEVDSDTGLMRTKKALDREKTPMYSLLVEAKDSALTEPRSATTNVQVFITDENDNAPTFAKKDYVIYIANPTQTGDFVFGNAAVDPDAGDNGRIIYHLSGDDAAKFDLDQWAGVIKASTELTEDRTYDVIVGAQDFGSPPLSSSMRLKINLRDKHLFPTFKPTNTVFTFREDQRLTPITTIEAISPKEGAQAEIRYEIAGGNIGEAFRVDEKSGVLSISENGMDYELLKKYELYVSAHDSDNPPLGSTILFVINTTDFNDNAPQFSQTSYNASLMEDLYPPQLVTTVSATDSDSMENAQFYYRLKAGKMPTSTFTLDASTGKIYTKVKLKREEIERYELVVEAVDKGVPSRTGSAMVVVNVQDKNNNPPRFTRLFSVNVTENAAVGTFVIQVTSSDRDIGENANVSYSFTENPEGKFHIDPVSGNVTVANIIDREQRDEYALKVSASDGSWKAETPLTITVQDQNDNAPQFDDTFYEFNFPEMQRSVAYVGQVRAVDRDKQGANSAINFSLKFPSDFFSINSVSGEILSKQALKYKHTIKGPSPENLYHLTIVATDSGKPPMSSETTVVINVVDANNNRPRFEKPLYFSPVPKTAQIGQKIVQVQAIDDHDYGINAQVVYGKIGGNGSEYFTLEPQTGWIRLSRPLTHDIGTQFGLLVRAKDRGVPPLHAETLVQLVVTGENQFEPKFTASSYQVIIAENENIASTIGTVTATDNDVGPNGIVRYLITSGNEAKKFQIDEKTGVVTINNELDYDSVQAYRLNISAHDLAFEPLYATAVLTVLLTDVNDNPPIFSQTEYKAYIAENSNEGTTVFQLNATDLDSAKNAIIQYNIVGGSGKSFFNIHPDTGLIKSTYVFDYEEKNSYTLDIIASNPDSRQRTPVKVFVYVTGKNEFYPKFIQQVFQFTVSESVKIGTLVGGVQATDADKGDDGIVQYLLVGASNDRGFHIDSSTGVLSVSRSLDREKQNRVVLTVMAKNEGSIRGNDTDVAQIRISIEDGNDPPEFDKPVYQSKISEGVPIGTKVQTVRAVDSDVRPQNNQFTYTIVGGNIDQVFKVDPQTGVIETTSTLDREKIAMYNLTIGAIDNGTPSQTGTTLVQVELEDINDNGPSFSSPVVTGYVFENEPMMTSVLTLSATDPDLPPNTFPFRYFIVGGEHQDFFTVDKNTGEVKTTRVIDRETTPQLTFRIQVEDNGKPKMKSQHPVTVIVSDKNDSPSTPRSVNVKVLTYKGIFPGGKIADVHPNDPDATGQYVCQILRSDSPMFSIANACNLHATKGSHHNSYTLKIYGNDGIHQDVTSKVKVEFDSYSNKTLQSSLVLRLLNVSTDRFLRIYHNSLVHFVQNEFQAARFRLFSIANQNPHTDVTFTVQNLSDDQYPNADDLRNKLKSKRNKLRQSLPGLEFIISYDPCDEDPCKNDGICSSTINSYNEMETTDTPSLVFTHPVVRNEMTCKCRQGFHGERCELRQDPCSPNPCQFGGTCGKRGFKFVCSCPPSRQGSQCEVDKTNACDNDPCKNGGSCQTTLEGGFFCLCRPGFRGNQCELESESCRPNPCQNGGSCVSLRPGYRCSCSMNFYGAHCEKSTFGFDQLSFMTFPTMDSTTNDISVVFSTNKPDSLLVYNYGLQTGGRSDFVAIEITGGMPRFSYGGARTEIVGVSVNKKVTDGQWYKVTATRNGRVMSLSVSQCSGSGDVCTECKPADPHCYSDAIGPTGTLNFNNEPMHLGGVMTVDPIQERPNQVHADDFVGCVQSVSINGRPLNLSGPIQQRGISNTCKRTTDVCSGSPCGEGGVCLDRWSTYKCVCKQGFLASNCNEALKAVTFSGQSYIEFLITEQHRRKQLLPELYRKHSRWIRQVKHVRQRRQVSVTSKHLSLTFRTHNSEGVLLHSATNNDFTLIEVRAGLIQYTSKLGANRPMNMTVMEHRVDQGLWHNLTLLLNDNAFVLILDEKVVGEQLEMAAIHDFLDAYLTSFTLGAAPKMPGSMSYDLPEFVGCMATLNIDGEIQPFNSSEGSLMRAVPHGVIFDPDCSTMIGPSIITDPLSVGITLVIVFFVLLLVAIFVSFLVYRVRRQKKEKEGGPVFQNGSALLANTSSESGRTHHDSGYMENAEMTEDVLRSHLSQEIANKKYKDREHERPQRPDIIEREIINKSPGAPLRVNDTPHGTDSLGGLGHLVDPEPEHYDLENASSIAPSDIDIVYHYKGYRDGNIRKYKTNPHVPGYHKHNHRHSPHNFPNTPHRESPRNILRQSPNPVAPRDSPSVLKMQSTPLARLSPSSELSQQTPRILTLKDISGKPLQTALLATSQGAGVKDVMSNSERSLNSPVSHLSQSSGSIHASSQSAKKKKMESKVGRGLTADDIERLNGRPRNSSLLSTLDAVSSSSEDHRKEKLAELIETNTELLEAPDSSTDESGNDSFTCSEFEYDNNYEKVTRDFGPGTMIFSKLAEVDNENEHDNESSKNFDGFDSFRGSLSTLVASDDDLSNMSSYKPPNGSTLGWDYLLNWGPNYESLVGVFKDIAELPDGHGNGRVSNRCTPKPNEEYV